MKNKPLISVIIPVYNEERYLSFCLDSIVNQTYKKLELIIVDDGSTDRSIEIAKKYNAQILKQNHKGAGAARNRGARVASGEILVFPDADMKYDTEYIEKLVNPIITGREIGTFNKIELVANPQNVWSRCWSVNSDLNPGKRTKGKVPDRMMVFRAIEKSAFQRSGGFDETLGYSDDKTVSQKLKKLSVAAPGAKAYHYNPETLSEVFYSARWIGRGEYFKANVVNFFRFSFLNSLRISLRKVLNGAPLQFIIFKIVFDFGILSGIFLSSGKKEK